MRGSLLIGWVSVLGIFDCAAQAKDLKYFDQDARFTFSAGLGVLSGQADEYVYDPATGEKISELNWKIVYSPTFNFGGAYKVNSDLSFYGNAVIGLNGDNYMDDYDWLHADFGLPASVGWTDHSWHDDTVLDHYFSIDAGAKIDFYKQNATTFSIMGGGRYTDVQWSAYGGCFLYSTKTFHDTSGCFPADEAEIRYRQMLPAAYLGLSWQHQADQWDYSLGILAGLSFNTLDNDNHWGSAFFVDYGSVAPYVGLRGNLSYAIGENSDVFIKGEFDRYFESKGPTDVTDTNTGAFAHVGGNASGMALGTVNVSVGLSYQF